MFHPALDADGAWLGGPRGGRRGRAPRRPDAAAPLHRRWDGARPCPLPARRGRASLSPLPSPPSVRVFDRDRLVRVREPGGARGPRAHASRARDSSAVAVDAGLAGLVGLDAVVAVSPVARLRAPALAPPKDRDFGIVLGPWFTTMDEAPAAPAGNASRRGRGAPRRTRPDSTGRPPGASRRRTRVLRVGDLLVAPAAVVARVPPGARRARRRGSRDPLRAEVGGCRMTHTFRRLDGLPPYVFAVIRELTLELRRAGEDVVDLGFGNPDLPSPGGRRREAPGGRRQAAQPPLLDVARASQSSGPRAPTSTGAASASSSTPRPRSSRRWARRKGSSHLMWALVEPGDAALVPAPSYPIHIHAPILAGASVFQVAMAPDEDLFANLADAYARASPRPRVLLLSFPHNPTTATVELDFMAHVVEFAREREMLVVHDFAYADLAFDGHEPPSILQVPGARGRRGRAVHADEVVLDGRLARRASSSATPRSARALARLKSWLDYGTFQPIQIAAITAMNEAPETPDRGVRGLPLAARRALRRPRPRGLVVPAAAGNDVRLGARARAVRRRWARSPSRSTSRARPGSRSRPARASAPAARASSASRSSRTSTGSARPCAGIRRVLEPARQRGGPPGCGGGAGASPTTSPTTTSAGAGQPSAASAIASSVAVTTPGRGACRARSPPPACPGTSPAATRPSASAREPAEPHEEHERPRRAATSAS